jgi:glycosyl hydrolase family 59/glycosyl hydrolase family 59 (putative galactocerebrosidase)
MNEGLQGERADCEPKPRETAGRIAKVAARILAAVALVAGCGPVVAAKPASAPSLVLVRTQARAMIVIDGSRPGPLFQGIGAISGGGGNSRLLIDYPSREREQILDYLFAPHFGASLQLLKLEIGGGGFSSDGSEPSVEPVRGALDCGAGYEFWLARQALARNPAIKLYGLQWSAPSWVSDGHGGLWSTADVHYVVDWLRCARENGVTISYIGGWNEHYQGTPVQQAWFVNLRRALDLAGFTSTQIVAADQTPQLRKAPGRRLGYFPLAVSGIAADGMTEDPAFARAVGVLGLHDTCGLPTTGYCVMADKARALAARLRMPLWESELGAIPSTGTDPAAPGPGALARALINAYNDAGITGILVWPLADAIPPDLPHENRGLVWADQPWDGSYYVTPLTWVIAQTTQFTVPGWRHVDGANGGLPANGSYVSYEAPGRTAWTLVAQTSVATMAQQVTVHIVGGLPTRVVHVWSTNLRGPGQFVRRADITPHGGTFNTVLQPGFVYTFTTTTGQSRAGGHLPAVLPAHPMPLSYTAAPDAAGLANMLAPIEGSFGYVHGVLTQTTAGEPVEWRYPGSSPAPYAIVGQNTWLDYTVSARVVLPRSGPVSAAPGAALIARFQGFLGTTVSQFRGYELKVRSDGAWQLTANGPRPVTLASGTVDAAYTYAMSLSTRGATISARINGASVATVINRAYRDGPAGLASLGYYPVEYPSFSVS